MRNNKLHVHFMGICGSGCASIAFMALEEGYFVSGCDRSTDSYYAKKLRDSGIIIYKDHSESHIEEDVDIVAVSPAIFDISPDNPELIKAREKGILYTWQEFTGKYLQKGKKVVSISGTHGKTTTTFLTSEILIEAGLDPLVVGGSVYKKWESGGRIGKGDIFVMEADEFNRNFYNYNTALAVLTCCEMDHPECFKDEDDYENAFVEFLRRSTELKAIVVNADSTGNINVIRKSQEFLKERKVSISAYTKNQNFDNPFMLLSLPCDIYVYKTEEKNESGTVFSCSGKNKKHIFKTALMGEYNVANSVAAFLVSKYFGVKDTDVQKAYCGFSGVGRRFDFKGYIDGIPVYDDYAHHPTEIASVLGMCREYFPGKKILAVFEPHQVSRLRLMFKEYTEALLIADHVIICKTHIGREINKGVTPFTKEEWEGVSLRIHYEEAEEEIKKYAVGLIKKGEADMIIVIGAANSYKISGYLCGF